MCNEEAENEEGNQRVKSALSSRRAKGINWGEVIFLIFVGFIIGIICYAVARDVRTNHRINDIVVVYNNNKIITDRIRMVLPGDIHLNDDNYLAFTIDATSLIDINNLEFMTIYLDGKAVINYEIVSIMPGRILIWWECNKNPIRSEFIK